MNQWLLVALSGDYRESDVVALKRAVEVFANGRRWTVRPPQFIDETDASSCTAPDDVPVRTLGAALEVTAP